MWCKDTWKNDYPCITVWISVAKFWKGQVTTCNYSEFLWYLLSVLTRILPFSLGSPRNASVEKQGPCKNIRGGKVQITTETALQIICYMNNLIQHGRWGVCDSITMHAPIFAMYVGPTKVKEIKLSTLSLLRSCFLTKQSDGVLRWPFKLYLTADVLLKVRLTHSMPLRPNKCIFLAFYVPSQIFLWEFQSPPPTPLQQIDPAPNRND